MSEVLIAYERNFDTLLLESVGFLVDSLKHHPVMDENHSLSRASILFSLMMLEAAANTCTEQLDLEGAISKEIDRLPILGKFDFYLRTKFRSKKLERGTQEVEIVKELKGIRDGIVHLKPHRVEWTKYSDTGESTQAVRTPVLGVATNPKFWDGEDAARVAKGVHEFLSYFFKKKCRYSASTVASILFSETKVPGQDKDYPCPCIDKTTKNILQEHGIDLSYIRIAWA